MSTSVEHPKNPANSDVAALAGSRAQQSLTVGRVLQMLMPELIGSGVQNDRVCEPTLWPPDVFAVAGFLLDRSGAYRVAIENGWWPKTSVHPAERLGEFQVCGRKWRRCVAAGEAAPEEVNVRWRQLLDAADQPLDGLDTAANQSLTAALLDLVAMADLACEGIGLPHSTGGNADDDRFHGIANLQLLQQSVAQRPSTLCRTVDAAVVCVLPKLHTPQAGLTFRGLTHHLALYLSDEVRPAWSVVPWASARQEDAYMELLVVPYPFAPLADQCFRTDPNPHCGRASLPEGQKYFHYNPPPAKEWLQDDFRRLLQNARERTDAKRLHAVVFPESSLTGEEEFQLACRQVQAVAPEAFVVAGVCEHGPDGEVYNRMRFALPVAPEGSLQPFERVQSKHHRWKVDRGQVSQYGLSVVLPAGETYWEHIRIPQRELHFFALRRWLTCCALICEDLARQEPVARLVRSVGPTLVIALLLDGPQISQRWSARYAAVLAEDPGSAVLSLTSAGMVARSRRVNGKGEIIQPTPEEKARGLCIALWRDPVRGTREIFLAEEARGVLLSLSREHEPEYSLDGRSFRATHLTLDRDPVQVNV